MVEGIDLTLDSIREELSSIKQRLSQLRKKGFDTKIAELRIMAIPSKIKLAEATRDFKDIEKINGLLKEAQDEAEGLEAELLNKSNQKEISILIEKIESFIKENKIKEAKQSYTQCINIYKNLPEDYKKEILGKLNEILAKLT